MEFSLILSVPFAISLSLSLFLPLPMYSCIQALPEHLSNTFEALAYLKECSVISLFERFNAKLYQASCLL